MSHWWPVSIAMVGTARLRQLCSHFWWHEGKAVVWKKKKKKISIWQALVFFPRPVALTLSLDGIDFLDSIKCGCLVCRGCQMWIFYLAWTARVEIYRGGEGLGRLMTRVPLSF